MKPTTLGFLALAALATGCSTPAASPRAPAPDAKVLSPLIVTWEGAELTPGELRVTARIERKAPLALPFTVRLTLPAGATLTQGRAAFELPANAAASVVTEPYRVTFAGVPEHDLVLHVDGEGAGLGFHGQVPYRFGRPAPQVPVPSATDQGPVRHGVDVGASIPLRQ